MIFEHDEKFTILHEMNLIKIVILMKKRFAESYDIRLYRKHSPDQFVIKQYKISSQKIVIDEEK